MSNFSDLEFTPSLRDRVVARIHNGSLRDFDFGSYDFSWLDSRDGEEIRFQLEWLDETAAECRVDGYTDSAEAYEEVLEIVQIESQPLFQSSSGGVASTRALEIRNETH